MSVKAYQHKQSTNSNANDFDEAVGACQEWLDRHAAQVRAITSWQRVESELIHEHGWFDLDGKEQSALPKAATLDAISSDADKLCEANQELLARLSEIKASSLHGIARKLSVVLEIIPPEQNYAAHTLMQSIIRDLNELILRATE